jgi:hypothetical protein
MLKKIEIVFKKIIRNKNPKANKIKNASATGATASATDEQYGYLYH